MLHILTIIGARPQIIKAAAISRALQTECTTSGVPFRELIQEDILHTGQHYDENMSQVFFSELGIPHECYNLHVGSASHGKQTALILEGVENVLQQRHYDGVIIYGDTNSTVAAALAAAKLQVPVFHVEAGLRSFDMSMPEELNRITADHLSQLLFAPTDTAVENLQREGLCNSLATFADGKHPKVCLTGDVMYDNALYFAQLAEQKSTILRELQLSKKQFVLATVHRPVNTDNADRLNAIFSALVQVAETMPVVLPLHPRTRKLMETNLRDDIKGKLNKKDIHIIPPASFFDILLLEKYAAVVVTDSGGVQKEAFFFQTPTIILRQETEWVEIINADAGVLADASESKIVAAVQNLQNKNVVFPPLFGDTHAAKHILQEIVDYLN